MKRWKEEVVISNSENDTQIDSTEKKDVKFGFLKSIFKKIYSIRTRLTLAFLIPVAFIIILSVISYAQAEKGLKGSYENTTLSAISSMAKYVSFGLDAVQEKSEALRVNEVLVKYYSGLFKNDPTLEGERLTELKSSISSEILSLDYVSNVFVLPNYGEAISGSGVAADKLDYDDYVANGEAKLLDSESKKGLWLGFHPYLDELTGSDSSKYSLSYINPVYDILSQPIGCIVLNVSSDFIEDTLSGGGLPEGSILGFITGDGREITYGDIPEGYKISEQTYYKEVLQDGSSADGSNYIKMSGKDYLFVYSKLDTIGSVLVCSIPKSAIMAEANRLKMISFVMVLIASVIAIGLGTLIAYGFAKTIKDTNAILYKAGTGDLTCRTAIKRKDEFRILGNSINDLLHNMKNLILKMTNTSNTVSGSAAAVSDSSDMLVTASKNISAAVNDINNGVTQQAADAESCLLQMSDLSEKINKLYGSTHNIEQIAENTEQVVNDGMKTVDNLRQKTNDTKKATDTVIGDIEHLEKESQAIYGIVETINGIAEQTNLLSLNASIEAAKAGEFGRGFSVVASEIRKLADQSLKSSGEIAKIIKRIEDQMKKTAMTAKHTETIVLSQEEVLSSTVRVFTDINKHVENLTINLNQIVTGTEGIENAKKDTLRSIESISATTQETAAATEELSAITVNQLDEVNKLSNVIQQLNDDAVNLSEAVHVFKIMEE